MGCTECKGDATLLMESGKQFNHISNVNEWDSDPNSQFPKCMHPTLPPEEQRTAGMMPTMLYAWSRIHY